MIITVDYCNLVLLLWLFEVFLKEIVHVNGNCIAFIG